MEVIDVAKWFINKTSPDPLKLQELIYLAQGFSFAFNDKELFSDELEVSASRPVVRTIYQLFESYNGKPITEKYELPKISEDDLSILNYVKENYSEHDDENLKYLCSNQSDLGDKVIDKYELANYFTNLIYQPNSEEGEISFNPNTDPFYSEENMKKLLAAAEDAKVGRNMTEHELIDVD